MSEQINGLTIAELSKQYGVTKNTIQNWRKELGIETVQISANKIVVPDSELERFEDLAKAKIAANKRKNTETTEVLNGGSLAIAELEDDLMEASDLETDDEIAEIQQEAETDETIRSLHYWSKRYQVRNTINSSVKRIESERRERKLKQLQTISTGRLALGK